MLHGGEVVYRAQQPVGHVRRADWSHAHAHTSTGPAGCRGVCALFVGAGGPADKKDGALLSTGAASRTRVPLEALDNWALAPQVSYEVGLAHNIRVPINLLP